MIPNPCKQDCPKRSKICHDGHCIREKIYKAFKRIDMDSKRKEADKTAFGIDVRAKVAKIQLKKSYQN